MWQSNSNSDSTGPGPTDPSGCILEGDRHYRARNYAAAVAKYESAAGAAELPSAELCAKLARGLQETGRLSEACEWALRVAECPPGFSSWSAAAKVIERCGSDAIPRIRRRLRVGLVGTWTTQSFVPLFKLAAARLGVLAEVYEAPFDQYFNETLDSNSPLFRSEPEALILCPNYHSLGLPAFSNDAAATIRTAVERWASVWAAARSVAPLVILQHNFALPGSDGFGHFGAGMDGSWRNLATGVNRELSARASREDVGMVDADLLSGRFGKDQWFDDRNWHLAKIAVAPAALPLLARHTAAVLAARLGLSRRCLVMDLDNTLWGGVIGDDGLGGLTLGGGPDGEAYVDFQRAIKDLNSRGVVLAVCSKNEPDIAREPFVSHPEMVLRLDDIAAFVANWKAKSENLVEIARILNLGLDTLTFVDDNPYERAEVRRALPEVDVIALPSEPTGYRRSLEAYPYFEPATFTAEDQGRSAQYQARAKAEILRAGAGSLEEYQAGLSMVATLGPIDEANIARVVQLINKTNQFNLTTRRRERHELETLIGQVGVEHFWVRLRDRFADHGLIAVVIAKPAGDYMEIDTLLMSCRVIGRGVETLMRNELAGRARRAGCEKLRGIYIPTPRNKLVADLFPKLGFDRGESCPDGGASWTFPVSAAEGFDIAIEIERPVGTATIQTKTSI